MIFIFFDNKCKGEKIYKGRRNFLFLSVLSGLMEVWCLGGFDELLPPIAQLQPQRKAQVFEKLGFDVRFGDFCHYVQLLFVFE